MLGTEFMKALKNNIYWWLSITNDTVSFSLTAFRMKGKGLLGKMLQEKTCSLSSLEIVARR